jgi:2-haloacid dehalogenase
VVDVIETLFDIQPLEKKLKAAALPAGSLKVWFARVLRDAFALEIAGDLLRLAQS